MSSIFAFSEAPCSLQTHTIPIQFPSGNGGDRTSMPIHVATAFHLGFLFGGRANTTIVESRGGGIWGHTPPGKFNLGLFLVASEIKLSGVGDIHWFLLNNHYRLCHFGEHGYLQKLYHTASTSRGAGGVVAPPPPSFQKVGVVPSKPIALL